jgi:trans-aconitate methyltransferase
MKWDAQLYDEKHDFVSKYAEKLVEQVNSGSDQTILDLGCGTGKLSIDLARNGARVVGLDMSEEMIRKAKSTYPSMEFFVADARKMEYIDYFDTVFSNAVLHWIKDQKTLLQAIWRALKPGGHFICEFGAYHCIYQIQSAFREEYEAAGYVYEDPFFYPTSNEYSDMLREAGFEIVKVIDFDRPTPLVDGENGLRNWMKQFFAVNLAAVTDKDADRIFLAVEKRLRPVLFAEGTWTADYRRIQAFANKPERQK